MFARSRSMVSQNNKRIHYAVVCWLHAKRPLINVMFPYFTLNVRQYIIDGCTIITAHGLRTLILSSSGNGQVSRINPVSAVFGLEIEFHWSRN